MTPVRPEKGRQPVGYVDNDHAGRSVSSKRYFIRNRARPGRPAPSPTACAQAGPKAGRSGRQQRAPVTGAKARKADDAAPSSR